MQTKIQYFCRIHYVTGRYPYTFLDAWRRFQLEDEGHKSIPECDNDAEHEYVVLVYELGGKPLITLQFSTAEQVNLKSVKIFIYFVVFVTNFQVSLT